MSGCDEIYKSLITDGQSASWQYTKVLKNYITYVFFQGP